MIVDVGTAAELDPTADPTGYARAILNILGDSSEEKTRLADVQSAMLNILEDSGAEKLSFEATQQAAFNILADFVEERDNLADVQKAVLNILEDMDAEKNMVERINRIMVREIDARQEAEEKIHRLNEGLEQRTAQLEASNKELEAFAYSVSHDLRAPLRAIDGFSRIITEDYADKLDGEGRRLLNVVGANAQKMDTLIGDLLLLSRVTRSEIKLSRIDMTAMVQSIYDDIASPEVQERFEFSLTPLPEAEGDPTLIRQAWINLLSNAIKFTATRDERRIEVGSRSEDGTNVYYVKDSGVGFNANYTHKLFGVFQRLHKAEEFDGTGIGLAIVQRIVLRHGGRVWAESKVGEGATFYFTLQEG